MDNLGDWLYILILIVAGVSGLFGSSKKKKNISKTLGDPESEPAVPTNEKGFWELLHEMQNEPEKPKPIQKPAKVKQVKKTKQTVRPDRVGGESFLPGELTQPTTFREMKSSFADRHEEDDNYILGDDPFHNVNELRKAVIYTEILNRKY